MDVVWAYEFAGKDVIVVLEFGGTAVGTFSFVMTVLLSMEQVQILILDTSWIS